MKQDMRKVRRIILPILLLLCCIGVMTTKSISRAETKKNTCTIVFISNCEESIPTKIQDQGTYLTDYPKPTREGYTFDGWYINEELTLRVSNSYFLNVSNQDSVLVLYAKWNKILVRSITAVYSEKTVTINKDIDRSKLTVNALYSNGTLAKVENYNLDKTRVESLGINIFTVTYEGTTTTFYVVGIEEKYYKVTFVSNGGNSIDPITGVKEGDTIIFPENPTRSGYTFKGWYQDSSYNLEFTTKTPITYNMFAYAKWEEDKIIEEKEVYELNKTSLIMKPNATENIFIVSYNPDLENYVEYESSKPKVVSVDKDGTITALKSGKATIYVTAPNGKLLKCKVTVNVKTPAKKLQMNVNAKRIKVGEKFTLKATLFPTNTTVKKVSFTSLDKKIATVNKDGTVLGKKPGVCYIEIKTVDGTNIKKKVKIRVVK